MKNYLDLPIIILFWLGLIYGYTVVRKIDNVAALILAAGIMIGPAMFLLVYLTHS